MTVKGQGQMQKKMHFHTVDSKTRLLAQSYRFFAKDECFSAQSYRFFAKDERFSAQNVN